MALISPRAPGLQEATKNSTLAWQEDLEALFHHAKDRFPDVVWEVDESEEVWGHKAIVYARAPPSFQNRYFAVRSGVAGGSGRVQESSSLSLIIPATTTEEGEDGQRTPSPRPISPNQTNGTSTLLRLSTSINPSLFSDELEYLYTGKGFGEAFEFLFDSSDSRERSTDVDIYNNSNNNNSRRIADPNNLSQSDAESARIDKLRKDLVFMWRSRLYSDVRIALTGNFGGNHENTTAIFSSHRFILVSRSSYFHTALISWPGTGTGPSTSLTTENQEPQTLTLPSPPFTPASLHFTLGFIYTGTLIFSHRSYDLSTAFSLIKAALYLSLSTLHDETQARIVQEMMHGLFHAFIPFSEYELITGGRWGTGGCRCRQCARRTPRVLEFALEEDVRNPILERGARRAMVGMFGEGWCTPEYASLSLKLRDSLVRGVSKRSTPINALPLLFAAHHALEKLGGVIDPWADVVRGDVGAVRRGVDEVLCVKPEECFESDEWLEIMHNQGVGFQDGEKVAWAMAGVMRGLSAAPVAAPKLYQTLVSSIVLRPHPTDSSAAFLPITSHIRTQVEQTRVELIKWIGKRWLGIRQERGFDELEGWALKEIGDGIEVPIDDLLSPPSYSSQKTLSNPSSSKRNSANILLRPSSNHPHTSKADVESDAGSSMRVSVLSRSIGGGGAASGRGQGTGTSISTRSQHSIRGDSKSTHSLATSSSSIMSNSTISAARRSPPAGNGHGNSGEDSPARRIVREVREGRMRDRRPDSKLTPSSPGAGLVRTPSIVEPGSGLEEEEDVGLDQEQDQDQDEVYEDEEDEGLQPSESGEEHEHEQRDDESLLQSQDDEDQDDYEEGQSQASDIPSVYLTPRPLPAASTTNDGKHRKSPTAGNRNGIQKTLITRASLASVTSRSSAAAGAASVRPRTTSSTSVASTTSRTGGGPTTPRHHAPSIKSQTTPARKAVLSTSTSSSSIRTSHYSTAASSSRPNSRGSAYSVSANNTPKTGRLTTSTTKASPSSSSTTSKPVSRPVSRVSTVRSVSGGVRPTSTASTATATTDTSSASTYRTAPAHGGQNLTTPLSQRQRKTSATSATSSIRTAGGRSAAGSPVRERTRRVSGASVNSVASNASVGRTRPAAAAPAKRSGATAQDPTKLSPVVPSTRSGRIQASTSGGSMKSIVSSSSVSSAQKKSPTTTTGAGVRARTLSNKKSIESIKKPAEGASKTQQQQVAEKAAVPPVPPVPASQTIVQQETEAPPSPSTSIPPELPSKDVDVKVDVGADAGKENDKKDVLPTQPQDLTPPPVSTSEAEPDPDTSLDEFSPANTTSTMTVRQKVYQPEPNNNNEHKKTSSSASSSSVATLRRKGSTDTIRTVRSSGLSGVPGGSDGVGSVGSKAGSGSGRSSNLSQQHSASQMEQQQQQHASAASMTSPPLPPLPLPLSSSPSPKPNLSSSLQHVSSPPYLTSLTHPPSLTSLLATDDPQGSTLEIGIPCIISSKRKRFKAYARYIGEVKGEFGPWVGVEVPMPVGGGMGDEDTLGRQDERQWNDGSWGGIRYFEIGGGLGCGGSEWDYPASGGAVGEDRAARRRRIDGGSVGVGAGGFGYGSGYGYGKGGLKREADQLSISSDSRMHHMKRMRSVSPAVSDMSGTESRGLFVRPQQVLYVVDAVGADL